MVGDWSGNPEAPVPRIERELLVILRILTRPLHLSVTFHNASASKIHFKGAFFPTTLTMVGAWPLTLLYVQAVTRRLRAGRLGFETRRTMASQSEPYDAVVIGGGVFVHPDAFVWK